IFRSLYLALSYIILRRLNTMYKKFRNISRFPIVPPTQEISFSLRIVKYSISIFLLIFSSSIIFFIGYIIIIKKEIPHLNLVFGGVCMLILFLIVISDLIFGQRKYDFFYVNQTGFAISGFLFYEQFKYVDINKIEKHQYRNSIYYLLIVGNGARKKVIEINEEIFNAILQIKPELRAYIKKKN
ncbi:MAG: hypothetical protein QW728_02925, partial [Thermoplasmata archaeon]